MPPRTWRRSTAEAPRLDPHFVKARLLLRAQVLDHGKGITALPHDVGRDLFIGPGRHPKTCPIAALRRYLKRRTDSSPFLFAGHWLDKGLPLGPNAFNSALQRQARKAGIPPRSFSPFSLRCGAAREAARNKVDPAVSMTNLGIRDLWVFQSLAAAKRSPGL